MEPLSRQDHLQDLAAQKKSHKNARQLVRDQWTKDAPTHGADGTGQAADGMSFCRSSHPWSLRLLAPLQGPAARPTGLAPRRARRGRSWSGRPARWGRWRRPCPGRRAQAPGHLRACYERRARGQGCLRPCQGAMHRFVWRVGTKITGFAVFWSWGRWGGLLLEWVCTLEYRWILILI